MTLIRGKHTIQFGAQVEVGYDNYFQTNIGTGGFAFNGSLDQLNPTSPAASNRFRHRRLRSRTWHNNQGHFVNQTEGVAQVPAQTAGKQDYRAFFVADTWRITPKLTLNLGLRYELQGTWSERFNGLSYWDPTATNATVTGCDGTAGSTCPGDVFAVLTGRNHSRNNLPLGQKGVFAPYRSGLQLRPEDGYSRWLRHLLRSEFRLVRLEPRQRRGFARDHAVHRDDELRSLALRPAHSMPAPAPGWRGTFATFTCATPDRSAPRASSWLQAVTRSRTSRLSWLLTATPRWRRTSTRKYAYVRAVQLGRSASVAVWLFRRRGLRRFSRRTSGPVQHQH